MYALRSVTLLLACLAAAPSAWACWTTGESSLAPPVNCQDCGSRAQVDRVQFSGCDLAQEDRCRVVLGRNYTVAITFTPKQDHQDLYIGVWGRVGLISMRFPLQPARVCSSYNVSCPLKRGEQQHFQLELLFDSYWPRLSGSATIELYDPSSLVAADSGQPSQFQLSKLVCGQIRFQLVSPRTSSLSTQADSTDNRNSVVEQLSSSNNNSNINNSNNNDINNNNASQSIGASPRAEDEQQWLLAAYLDSVMQQGEARRNASAKETRLGPIGSANDDTRKQDDDDDNNSNNNNHGTNRDNGSNKDNGSSTIVVVVDDIYSEHQRDSSTVDVRKQLEMGPSTANRRPTFPFHIHAWPAL